MWLISTFSISFVWSNGCLFSHFLCFYVIVRSDNVCASYFDALNFIPTWIFSRKIKQRNVSVSFLAYKKRRRIIIIDFLHNIEKNAIQYIWIFLIWISIILCSACMHYAVIWNYCHLIKSLFYFMLQLWKQVPTILF